MRIWFLASGLVIASSPFLLLAGAGIIVDYHPSNDTHVLGTPELEGLDLGCRITNAGDAAYIRSGSVDPSNERKALHFHRDPHFRRAEVKALPGKGVQKAVEGKTYYIGYSFRLEKAHDGLVIFQWKKWDKEVAPKQNIPLYVHFNHALDLVIEYTIPGGTGSNREIVWTGPLSVGKNAIHHLLFAINTANNGTGWLEFHVDGVKQKFRDGSDRLAKVYLFTGPTSPKFGIYRGEPRGGGQEFCPKGGTYSGPVAPPDAEGVFDLYLYRVQISDGKLEDVKEAGLPGASPPPSGR